MSSEEMTRKAYKEKLEARLDQWSAELERLEAKAREAGADAKIELRENVNEVKQQWEAARRKVQEVHQASGAAWRELKTGADDAFEDLKDAVHRAQERLR